MVKSCAAILPGASMIRLLPISKSASAMKSPPVVIVAESAKKVPRTVGAGPGLVTKLAAARLRVPAVSVPLDA